MTKVLALALALLFVFVLSLSLLILFLNFAAISTRLEVYNINTEQLNDRTVLTQGDIFGT